ncbi:MAG: hypothetical protein AAF512_14725 [Pseudomonadota bacterium]
MQTHLTEEQKRQLYYDGYVIIKNAVPKETSQRAKELISQILPKDEKRLLVPASLATHEDVIGLFNDTCLTEIIKNEMGPFPDVISCQVAVTPAHNLLGGRPGPHVDGNWGGPLPERAEDIEMPRGRPKDPVKYFGENDTRRGSNDGQLWLDPDRTITLGCYTALVGVALNDQTKPGAGQFGVLKGMHEVVENAFRLQREAGGPIGPEGPGWPRIMPTKSGGTFLNGLHDTVRTAAKEAAKDRKATDDWPWPELTPVLLEQGDAVIALHSCPHTPTPNMSDNPRMNIYFRIRRLREDNPHEGSRRLGHGVSDHLDRGYYGQFLEYPDNYNPWKTSVDIMCDHWREWDGMQDIVKQERAKAATQA